MRFGKTLCALVAAAVIGLSSCKKDNSTYEKAEPEETKKALVYDSVEDLVQKYNKAIENDDHKGEAARWLNIAMKRAKTGETLYDVEKAVKIAKGEDGYNNNASSEAEKILRKVYDICIKTQGPKNADYWLNIAMKRAKTGETLYDVEKAVKIARNYATEAGIELNKDRIKEIREAYKIGINKFGPKNAAEWLRKTAERVEARKSDHDIKTALKIADGYAKEAGIELTSD